MIISEINLFNLNPKNNKNFFHLKIFTKVDPEKAKVDPNLPLFDIFIQFLEKLKEKYDSKKRVPKTL